MPARFVGLSKMINWKPAYPKQKLVVHAFAQETIAVIYGVEATMSSKWKLK